MGGAAIGTAGRAVAAAGLHSPARPAPPPLCPLSQPAAPLRPPCQTALHPRASAPQPSVCPLITHMCAGSCLTTTCPRTKTLSLAAKSLETTSPNSFTSLGGHAPAADTRQQRMFADMTLTPRWQRHSFNRESMAVFVSVLPLIFNPKLASTTVY